MSDNRSKILISVADLVVQLDARAPLVLLDVRDDANVALRPLIPGSIRTTLADDFSGAASKLAGKRPLPAIDLLQDKARAWGIGPDSLIVVYDAQDSTQAARAWWTLRWAGLDNVRILDGGLAAWTAAGRRTVDDAIIAPNNGTVTLHAGHMPTLEADEAAQLAQSGALLDARGKANYAAGHIPGGIFAPTGENVGPTGRFKSYDELRARFAKLGASDSAPVGAYCGSGNAAAHEVAALALIGIEAPLYVGSWSAWSSDPARPVETSEDAKRDGTHG
ncbi:MAG TPA: rhodanese-like domain-containing protein [Alphaproteobacteria bacterium]|nr:rhodanese-like domain-containing protein [Alphaproteobacteria bacterium]